MIELIITLLLLAVLLYVVNIILGEIVLPSWVKQIIYVIIALVVLLWLLGRFNIYSL